MRAFLTLPLLAALAVAQHSPYRSSSYGNINRYQGPTGRPIVFAKKSFFESDLSVQPSVLYRLVTLPSFAAPSFNGNGLSASRGGYDGLGSYKANLNDYNSGARYEDNAIDIDRPPALYYKGDSRLYAKKSFGNFGLSVAAGPKPVPTYRRDLHSLQGGYYRPWDSVDSGAYESAPRPRRLAHPYYGSFLFNREEPHRRSP